MSKLTTEEQNAKQLKKDFYAEAKLRKAKKISRLDLIGKLAELAENKYTKGYLQMVGDVKMNKRGNELFGRVTKFSGWGFDVNIAYTRKVNLQLEKEGKEADFVAAETYTEKVNEVVHRHKTNGTLYMSCFPALNFGAFSQYLVDNRPATPEEIAIIKSFLPAKSDSSRQGTEKEIIIRKPKLENIHFISLLGERYSIIDNIEKMTA